MPDRERPHDLRVEKTIDAIQAAFKSMMLETGFDKITVTALCERARVNKKTFYRYYPTIEYLLAEVQQLYVAPYVARTRNLRFPKDARAITRAYLEFSVAQDELYERITCAGPHDRVGAQMTDEVLGNRDDISEAGAPQGWEKGSWEVYLALVISAPLHAYQAWVRGGKVMPARDFIDMTTEAVAAEARAFEEMATRSDG